MVTRKLPVTSNCRHTLARARKSRLSALSQRLNTLCCGVLSVILIVGAPSGLISQARGQEKKSISIIVSSPEIPYFKEFVASANAKGATIGYEIVVLSDGFDVGKQLQNFEDAINTKAAAIVCADVYSSASLIPKLKAAKEKAIPCVLVGTRVDTSGVPVVQIVPNEYQGASAGAQEFVKLMREEGNYVELMGLPGSDAARIRSKGYNDTIARYSNVRKVAARPAYWDESRAFSETSNIVQQYPDIKGVICANDAMALGAEKALQVAGLRGKCIVVGFDGEPRAIQSIVQHGIQATVQIPVREMAEMAIEEADRFIKEGKIEQGEERLVECRLINYEVVEQLARATPTPTLETEAPSSPWAKTRIFASLLDNSERLLESPFGKAPTVEGNLRAIMEGANYLKPVLASPDIQAASQPEYFQGLTMDAWRLQGIASAVFGTGPREVSQWSKGVEYVKDSIQAKEGYAQKNPDQPAGTVTVHATTLEKDAASASGYKEVLGYEVWYCYKADESDGRHTRFGKLSSPTNSPPLPPGCYVFWTIKDSRRGRPLDRPTLGTDGQSSIDIDLYTFP
jgi:erythritol transport system substrate-binding protein